MKAFILIAIIGLTYISCGKKYQCPKEALIPTYTGYSASQVDTLILRRYQPGTNFTQNIDTIVLTNSNSVFNRSGDTTSIYANNPGNRLQGDYDYRLINPYDNKVVAVSNMQFQLNEGHGPGLFSTDPQPCYSPLLSYNRDNTLIYVSNPGFFSNRLYIKP